MTLNWVLATEETFNKAQVTPQPTAVRVMIDTPNGDKEFILQHVDIHADNFEDMLQLMPKDSFISDATWQRIRPVDKGGGGDL